MATSLSARHILTYLPYFLAKMLQLCHCEGIGCFSCHLPQTYEEYGRLLSHVLHSQYLPEIPAASLMLLLVSESHSHRRQQQSPDHYHLSSNHSHLQSCINTPISTTLSLTHIVRYRSLPRTVPDSRALLTCLYLPSSLMLSSQCFSSISPSLLFFLLTLTFSHLVDAFIQSDLQIRKSN